MAVQEQDLISRMLHAPLHQQAVSAHTSLPNTRLSFADLHGGGSRSCKAEA